AVNESLLRMAALPSEAVLSDAGDLWFQDVLVQNVYVCPGIPELLRRKFESIRDRFKGVRLVQRSVYVRSRESDIAGDPRAAAAGRHSQDRVNDLAAHEGWARLLAYAHPLWMLASLGLAALALPSGLALRAARRRGMRPRPEALRRHLALAKPAIAAVAIRF